MRLIKILELLVALAVIGIFAYFIQTPQVDAAFPGTNGQIAYSGIDAANVHEIYVINPDGSGISQVTHLASTFDFFPVWSPDGQKILFVRRQYDGEDTTTVLSDIYSIRPDGTDIQQLTHDNLFKAGLAWSSDGSKIAYESFDGIHVMNADGSGNINVTEDSRDSHIVWSDDGQRIFFASYDENDAQYVYRVDIDGENLEQVLSMDDVTFSSALKPFSVRGNHIVIFKSIQDPNDLIGPYDIFVSSLDGSGVTNITNDPIIDDTDPVLSPDGSKIVYLRQLHLAGWLELRVVNIDGTDPVSVSGLPSAYYGDAAWSPDGTKVFFSASDPQTFDPVLHIFDLASGELSRITQMNNENVGYFPGGADWQALNADETPENTPPLITFPQTGPYAGDGIDPNTGTSTTEFTFQVVYTDADDDTPTFVNVCITGVPDEAPDATVHFCGGGSGYPDEWDYTVGQELLNRPFGLTVKTPIQFPGTYEYYFEVTNAQQTMRFPQTGGFPLVIHTATNTSEYEPTQPVLGETTCDFSARNIVFITHGWNSNANGWVRDVATSIGNHLTDANMSDWAVCTFDWHESAEGPPQAAYLEAENEGIYVGQFLTPQHYDSIHFIAHSAGSNLIQTAADWIQPRSPGTKIHLTFLDAYEPRGASLSDYGLDPRNRNSSYTVHPDWWAEQYVDMRNHRIDIPGPVNLEGFLGDTNHILPDVYNFDITELDPVQNPTFVEDHDPTGLLYAMRIHGWPPDWYKTSVSINPARYGFSLSKEAGIRTQLPVVQFPSGQCIKLKMNGTETECTIPAFFGFTSTYIPVIHVRDAAANGSAQSGGEGTVVYTDPVTAVLRTGSPVWLDITATTTQEINSLQFDYAFLSNADSEGILSVFVDGQLKHKIDERLTPASLNQASDIWLGNLTPGVHIITFRLDPFTDAQSAVQISSIQLGLIERNEVIDLLPPTTSATTSGAIWKNGLYLGTTTVSFLAQDNDGGVGVEKTEYSTNNGQTWNIYIQTLAFGTIGTTTIAYRSTDFLGNIEDTKTLMLTIISVKGLLDDALAKLKAITTGNRDIDKATDAVERDLVKIIADKLWLDRNRLSWPKGASVLSNEVDVVRDIGDILNKAGQKKNNISLTTQAIYRDAQSEIVQSNALLAKLSFDKAKILKAKKVSGQKALDKAIARIQKMLDRAKAKETKNPAQATRLYGAAWFASEALLKAAGATPFRIADFGALYVPEDMKDLVD